MLSFKFSDPKFDHLHSICSFKVYKCYSMGSQANEETKVEFFERKIEKYKTKVKFVIASMG